MLKKGTILTLVRVESISSATATKGAPVRMVVENDVRSADGIVVIPKGTPATGIVKWVHKAIAKRSDGGIAIKAVNLNLPNGSRVALRNHRDREMDALGSALLPLVPFCAAAELIAIPFHRKHEDGKDQVYEACSEQTAELARTIVIQPNGAFEAKPIIPEKACPTWVKTTVP